MMEIQRAVWIIYRHPYVFMDGNLGNVSGKEEESSLQNFFLIAHISTCSSASWQEACQAFYL